jgi:hypothetical protein
MARGCRDCKICTRSGIEKLLWAVPDLIGSILFSWNIGLFKRRCPNCRHYLNLHQRRSDGSFKD